MPDHEAIFPRIARMMALGFSNKEIAGAYGLNPRTIGAYRKDPFFQQVLEDETDIIRQMELQETTEAMVAQQKMLSELTRKSLEHVDEVLSDATGDLRRKDRFAADVLKISLGHKQRIDAKVEASVKLDPEESKLVADTLRHLQGEPKDK